MEHRIFKLIPTAAPDDTNWDRAPNQGEVVVRAISPADARLVASEAEFGFLDSGGKPGDGTTTRFASAFRDDKLYSVLEVTDSSYSPEGPRELLAGELTNPLKGGRSATRSEK